LPGGEWAIGDLSHLNTPAPFIAMMPQWDFLDFLREEAKAFPRLFSARWSAPVDRLHRGEGQGFRRANSTTGEELRARLTIAADGRTSIVRSMLAGGGRSARRWTSSGSALPKVAGEQKGGLRGNVERSRLLVMIDRGDYWQCAFLIPKGAAEAYLAKGIDL
jgi:2-polyprenyl-6-methoxyphenol hydroxylase-like FAD-dependent oxidoreductase